MTRFGEHRTSDTSAGTGAVNTKRGILPSTATAGLELPGCDHEMHLPMHWLLIPGGDYPRFFQGCRGQIWKKTIEILSRAASKK